MVNDVNSMTERAVYRGEVTSVSEVITVWRWVIVIRHIRQVGNDIAIVVSENERILINSASL